MGKKETFTQYINDGYSSKGDSILLGAAILDGEPVAETQVKIPLKTLNRHGLIAGATGTGKTKTIQVLSEQLSAKGIPVLMMDIKGDFSGIAMPGEEKPFITERHAKINIPYSVAACPVELMSLSAQNGVRLRATVTEFGPVFIFKNIRIERYSSQCDSVIFKYCDDNKMPLLDLKDIKKVLNYINDEGKDEIAADYGKISTATTGIILRKIIELEQQGAELFLEKNLLKLTI